MGQKATTQWDGQDETSFKARWNQFRDEHIASRVWTDLTGEERGVIMKAFLCHVRKAHENETFSASSDTSEAKVTTSWWRGETVVTDSYAREFGNVGAHVSWDWTMRVDSRGELKQFQEVKWS
jgi:hypothetical protein